MFILILLSGEKKLYQCKLQTITILTYKETKQYFISIFSFDRECSSNNGRITKGIDNIFYRRKLGKSFQNIKTDIDNRNKWEIEIIPIEKDCKAEDVKIEIILKRGSHLCLNSFKKVKLTSCELIQKAA